MWNGATGYGMRWRICGRSKESNSDVGRMWIRLWMGRRGRWMESATQNKYNNGRRQQNVCSSAFFVTYQTPKSASRAK